jgi:hypothetical protein
LIDGHMHGLPNVYCGGCNFPGKNGWYSPISRTF